MHGSSDKVAFSIHMSPLLVYGLRCSLVQLPQSSVASPIEITRRMIQEDSTWGFVAREGGFRGAPELVVSL
jgi:hypothetical protein